MEETIKICKICLQTQTEVENVPDCHPCKCAGSLKYVHRSCLSRWLSTKKELKCELCFYRYKYNNVYKKNMPERINTYIVVKEVLNRAVKTIYDATKVIFALVIRILASYLLTSVYSYLFMEKNKWTNEIHFLGGPIIFIIIYLLKLFNKEVDKIVFLIRESNPLNSSVVLPLDFEEPENPWTYDPNTIRILNQAAEDLLLEEDLPDLSGDESTREEVMDRNISQPLEIADHDGRQSYFFSASPLRTLRNNLVIFVKGIFYFSLLWIFLKFKLFFQKIWVFKPGSFVFDTQITGFVHSILGIVLALLFFTFIANNYLGLHYKFKVAFVLYTNAILNPTIVGLSVLQLLYSLFGPNIISTNEILKKPFIFNINVYALLTYCLGFLLIVFVIKVLSFFKNIYRRGALHFLLSHENREPIREIIMTKLDIWIRGSMVSILSIIVFMYSTILFQITSIYKINIKIDSIKKIFLYIYLGYFILSRINKLNTYFKFVTKKLTFWLCKKFDCLDYFYGIKNINCDKSKLKTLPNRNDFYPREVLRYVYNRRFNEEEFRRYFLNRNDRSTFALFYVPNNFKMRFFIIHFTIFLVFQYFLRLSIMASFYISEIPTFFGLVENIDLIVDSDVLFLFSFGITLTLIYLILETFQLTYEYTYSMLCKKICFYTFKFIIWPAICTFFVLYFFKKLDNSTFIDVSPVTTIFVCFMLIFDLVVDTFFVLDIVFPIEILSFSELLGRLVFFTTLPAFFVSVSFVWNAILNITKAELNINGFPYRFVFYFAIMILVFFFVIVGLKKLIKFVVNWREELFLERRELVNYKED